MKLLSSDHELFEVRGKVEEADAEQMGTHDAWIAGKERKRKWEKKEKHG